MQRRKIDFTTKLKLSSLAKDELMVETKSYNKSELDLIKNSKNAKTVSFRLRKIDLDRLLSSLENANNINESHPFNRTDLLRGLILLGKELDPKKTLNYIRKSL